MSDPCGGVLGQILGGSLGQVGDPRATSEELQKQIAAALAPGMRNLGIYLRDALAAQNAAACAGYYVRTYTPPLPRWRRFMSWLTQPRRRRPPRRLGTPLPDAGGVRGAEGFGRGEREGLPHDRGDRTMKSLKEQITGRCRHYAAPMDHKQCDAGVTYKSMREAAGSFDAWPCFRPDLKTCPHAAFPSEAEADAEVTRLHESMERIGKARAAIVAVTGKWKRGHRGAAGAIDCPCCGKANALRYSMSGYNGHIHAACSTSGCASWME